MSCLKTNYKDSKSVCEAIEQDIYRGGINDFHSNWPIRD